MARIYIAPNARKIVKLICDEFALQAERVAGGFIEPDQVQGFLMERLNAKSKSDPSIDEFLRNTGPVPVDEDQRSDVPWAADMREDSSHEVRTSTPQPKGLKKSAVCIEDELDHPMPGERIC